jgi:hypothetical protein
VSGHAASAARSCVAELDAVSLPELVARAGLQTRVDTKFIVYPSVLAALVRHLRDEVDVLEIDGLRQFRYASTYFDTATWRTYRDHVQGRRLRFKARTRHYVDADLCMFEVKLEGARGSTEKLRTPHAPEQSHTLTPSARAHLVAVLAEAGIRPPEPLEPSLLTTYRRTTLVHASRPVRLTIDADLTCSGEPGTATALTDRVLLEVKTTSERDPVLRAIQRLGVRPLAVSKYCAGVALLHPEVPRHPWAAVLREHFAGAA